jgi:hypothetical protein
MVTQRERRQLAESYESEFMVALAVILKCAAGLLVVIAIAIIGIAMELNHDTGPDMQARR